MNFETIETPRLLLRRLQLSDAFEFSHYRSMPLVSRYQSAYSLERAMALAEDMQKSEPSDTDKWFQFAVTLHTNGKLIGDIGFKNTDEAGKSWIGYTLHPDYWHKGYAREAVQAVIDYYKLLGITNIWAATAVSNENSMKLLRSIGFTLHESKPDEWIFRL